MSTPSYNTAPTPLFDRIHQSFLRQGMMQQLGARLDRVAPGEVDIALPYSERVTQQQGGFHGGAIGALADIAGGYAGLTMLPEGSEIVTVEYKINFINACQGGELRATGVVLKAGKRIVTATAEVHHIASSGQARLCALMQQTLMPVAQNY